MPATPADIARYTVDGVLLTAPIDPAASQAIKGDHIDARDGSDREIEMFFDNAADAQAMLNERFAYLSKVNPIHLGIEIEETIGFGDTTPLTPTVPTFFAVDDSRDLRRTVRTRAYAQDMGTDRISIEVIE